MVPPQLMPRSWLERTVPSCEAPPWNTPRNRLHLRRLYCQRRCKVTNIFRNGQMLPQVFAPQVRRGLTLRCAVAPGLQIPTNRKQIMSAVQRITLTPKAAPIEPISDKVGFELRGLLVIKKIKVIYSVSDEAVNIEYIKNTYLSDKTMLERMGYCL